MKTTKNIFGLVLAVCMLVSLAVLPVFAETEGNYTYIVSDGVATITAVDKAINGTVEVPETLGGNAVVKIGNWAFSGCTNLKEITLPASVKGIGDWAFYNCANLKTITLPAGIKGIGGNAFLETAYHKNSGNWEDGLLYIGDYFIEAQEGLEGAVELKDSTALVGSLAFYGCSKITSVTIPATVGMVCDSAFRNSGITSITFGGTETQWSSVSIMANNTDLENAEKSFASAPVVVVLYGDVNGNGKVNAQDVAFLARNLAGWTGYETIDGKASDINDNGKVNAQDVALLARHLAGWTGYETLPIK